MRIPFVPFPIKIALVMSRRFLIVANLFKNFFPNLEIHLVQSNIKINTNNYISLAVFSFLFWAVLIFTTTFPFFLRVSNLMGIFSVVLSFVVSYVIFLNIIYYPKLLVTRRVRDIERNLVFAMRHIIIQVKSGVPLFDSFESVAASNYGLLSTEFSNLTKEVSLGASLTDSLENMIYRNPSSMFRRVLWQIINSTKAGVDLGNSLSNMLDNLSQDQLIQIRKYGSQLNPLALMFLMFSVIIPTLGVTFLIVFSIFAGFELSKPIFFVLIIFLVLFQFSFVGIIKNRRPTVGI